MTLLTIATGAALVVLFAVLSLFAGELHEYLFRQQERAEMDRLLRNHPRYRR